MKIAICGTMKIGMQIKTIFSNSNIEITHFITEYTQLDNEEGGG